MRRTHRAAVALLAMATAAGALVTGGAAAGQEQTTFTVGVLQDLDSFNVTVGALVSDYESWNVHYPTLTDKAAEDFAVEPGLAESWEASDDGQTFTYTLREGLEWSDGTPLTAEDVAYTVNRSRDEEWTNHASTVANLEATAIDDRTVEIASSVPDPKLPVMDVYIVPKHVYEKISADDLPSHDALDDPGGGPFVMKEWKNGEFWRMEANDSFWGGRPKFDELVFRVFTNADALVAALKQGEIDASGDVPTGQYDQIQEEPGVTTVRGNQGGFNELAMNAGDGLGDGHPALQDVKVRQAIAHAVDKETLVDRVLNGLGTPSVSISPGASAEWDLDLPADEQFEFDLDKANQLLDDAGYADTDGDGVREMPDGTNPLRFRFKSRSESETAAPTTEFITGWLDEIGIATEVEVVSDTQLTPIIAKGEYEMFVWGWVPFVDPDPMLSYFRCDEISPDPEAPGYNDANWCNEEYDRLYTEQNQELDPEKRQEIVQEMLKLFYDEASYVVLFKYDDINAFRSDRWTDVVCQPTDTGPFIFTNTSPIYTSLAPVAEGETGAADCGDRVQAASASDSASGEAASGGDDDSGSNTGLIVGLALGAVALIGGGLIFARSRSKTADERE